MRRKRFKPNKAMNCQECPFVTGDIIREIEERHHAEWIGQIKGFTSRSDSCGAEFPCHFTLWMKLKNEGKKVISEKELPNGEFCDLYVPGEIPEIYEVKSKIDKNSIGQAVAQLLSYQEVAGESKLYFVVPKSEEPKIKKWMTKFLNDNEIRLMFIEPRRSSS